MRRTCLLANRNTAQYRRSQIALMRGKEPRSSTHPNTENRIRELEKLAQEMAAAGTLPQVAHDYGRGVAYDGRRDDRQGGPWSRPRGPWG